MKVCVPLRCPAGVDLHADNLRGEPRNERFMLEALSTYDWVTDIYTTGCAWKDGSQLTSKYRGEITQDKEKETVLLMQDWWPLPKTHNYLAFIINIFGGCWDDDLNKINALSRKYGNRFVFTFGYPSLFEDNGYTMNFDSFLPDFVLLPYPGIIESRYENRFNKKVLLFPQRIVSMQDLNMNESIPWALNRLRLDSSLSLRILTGAEKSEVKDLINGKYVNINEDVTKYFWKMSNISGFKDVKDRVRLDYSLNWGDVLNIYKDTKLLVQVNRHFGGPPLEAAMHGIPFVGNSLDAGALCRCSDYLCCNADISATSLLDKLMDNEEFYTKIGKSYHDYAMELYSFEAYGKNLFNILKGMGLE